MLKPVFLLLLFPLPIEHLLTSVNSRGKVHVKFRKGRKKTYLHTNEQRQMPSNKAHLCVEFSLLIINAEFQNKGHSKVTKSPEKQKGGSYEAVRGQLLYPVNPSPRSALG